MHLRTGLFLLLSVVFAYSAGLTRSYANCMVIKSASTWNAKFYWTLSGNNINIGIESNAAKGYFSVGITSISGAMNGGLPADGWIISSNDEADSSDKCSAKQANGGCIGDICIPSYSVPDWDTQQSLTNIKVSKNGNMLYGEFDRALDTGDAQDSKLFTNNITFFMWAAHDSRQPTFGSMATHTKYGLFTATLSTASSCSTTTTCDGLVGIEGCPCTSTGVCDEGLSCASNLCVAPGALGNCTGLAGIAGCPCTPSGVCDAGLTCTNAVCTSSSAALSINIFLFTILVLLVTLF